MKPGIKARALCLTMLLAACAPAWATPAGTMQFVLGDVRIRDESGATRAVQRGAVVNTGDRITTGSTGTAQLRMIDDAFIALRPDTEMQVGAYAYSGRPDGQEGAVLRLFKGTMRAFTGAIATLRKDRFQMITPTATVGIRGSGNVLHFSPDLGTVNHTIEGAHVVRGLNAQGQPTGAEFVTRPGITVQVAPGGAPQRITTPQIIRDAVAPPPRAQAPAPQPTQQAQAGQAGQQTQQGQPAQAAQAATSGTDNAPAAGGTPRASAGADTVLTATGASPLGSPGGTSGGTATGGGSPVDSGTPATSATITGQGSNGNTVNLTNQFQQLPNAAPAPLTETPAQLAATAASAAAAASAALAGIVSANPAIATQMLTSVQATASPVVANANSANGAAQALDVSASLATTTSIATTAAASAATAASTASSAAAAYAARGAFADPGYATPAASTVASANSAAQAGNTTLQAALANVQSQAALLAQNKATTAAFTANMNALATTAGSSLAALDANLATLNAAGVSAGTSSTATAQSLLAIAQAAASASQAAATQAQAFESAGNTAGAQLQSTIAITQATIATGALSAAGSLLSGISAATASQSAATGVTASAAAAQGNASAVTANTPAPVTAAGSPAGVVQSNSAVVASTAPLAAYGNPAFSANAGQFAHLAVAPKAVAGGFENLFTTNLATQPNSNYVLDGSNGLVEIRNSEKLADNGVNYAGTSTSATARDIRFSGGTLQDAYRAPDNSIYLGRWQGGNMDAYAPGGGLPDSIPLGASSAHYLISANTPPDYVRTLTGVATYALAGATRPTDAFGNIGTLSSAFLNADFSAQSVSAGVNLSFSGARNLALAASAGGMAMKPDALSGASGAFSFQSPTAAVSCSGADCGSGYSASFNGSFSGNTASGAGLIYQLYPIQSTALANTARTDMISGVAAFSAGAPFVGTPIPVTGSGLFRAAAYYPVNPGGVTYLAVNSQISSATATLPAANILLDASGRVTRFLGTDWAAFNAGTDVNCAAGAPCLGAGAAGNPVASTTFSMAGGSVPSLGTTFNANGDFVASSGTESYSSGGIRFGRYQGGTLNAMDSATGSNLLTTLGGNSVVWSVREIPAALPLSGAYHYLPRFATAPADALGNVGTLYGAQLNANFDNQTVDVGVRLGINGYTLRAYAPGVSLQSGGQFDASSSTGSLRVSCFGANCAPYPVGTTSIATLNSGVGGRIQGGFGNGGADAFFRYTLNTFYDPSVAAGSTGGIPLGAPAGTIVNNYITGAVGFGQGPALQAGSNTRALTSYAFSNSGVVNTVTGNFDTIDGGAINFSGGRFVSATPGTFSNGETLTIGGATSVANGPIAVGNGTGITFGAYQGTNQYDGSGQALTVSGNDYTGTFSNRAVLGGLNWISGPTPWPVFISHVLSGTATYTGFVASAPADLGGNSYAVAPNVSPTTAMVAASLSVNFSNQSASSAISLTLPANPAAVGNGTLRAWSATASNVALQGDGSFYANANAPALTQRNAVISLNGTGGYGNISGSLTGALLNGAMVNYMLGAFDPISGLQEGVAGVIGFHSPSFNITQQSASSVPATQIDTLTPFQIMLRARGPVAGLDANATVGSVNSTTIPAAAIEGQYLNRTTITALDPSRVVINDQNALQRFDGVAAMVTTNPCQPNTCTPSANDIPVTLSIIPLSAGGPANGSPVAGVLDVGSDPVTGIRWGRYDTGYFAVIDRVTGAVLNPAITQGGINHYLLGATQTGATTLPASGSATYTFVGGTNPTDRNGVAGTLNAATLSANFGAQTVNASVNATVSGVNWTAAAANVPIIAGVGFEASKSLGGGGALSVGCSGGACVPGQTAGRITGAFFGSTGQGAGFAYSMFSGTVTPNVSVVGVAAGGVAAFKR